MSGHVGFHARAKPPDTGSVLSHGYMVLLRMFNRGREKSLGLVVLETLAQCGGAGCSAGRSVQEIRQ